MDAGDHPPITPTLKVASSPGAFGGDIQQWKLYELVCRNFMASISTDLLYEAKTYTFTLQKYNQQKKNQKRREKR